MLGLADAGIGKATSGRSFANCTFSTIAFSNHSESTRSPVGIASELENRPQGPIHTNSLYIVGLDERGA
jgi:hypothetical protein